MVEGVGEFVQLVFTTSQVDLLKRVLRTAELAENPATGTPVLEGSLLAQVQHLADFLDVVAEEPRSFPVTGRMATSIKKQNRQTKRMLKQLRKGLLA